MPYWPQDKTWLRISQPGFVSVFVQSVLFIYFIALVHRIFRSSFGIFFFLLHSICRKFPKPIIFLRVFPYTDKMQNQNKTKRPCRRSLQGLETQIFSNIRKYLLNLSPATSRIVPFSIINIWHGIFSQPTSRSLILKS